ncbi:FliI/YscN family ATPase [Undibacterium flavidum]|uniref:FliI/YscN family ATPase n=1 Tax=Undibacterium flavidum TaxID=2762297 RepID=A0ABR6YEZ6_9BURK|nr:FliI/YscN family ATPase [Undibacterium flavidum]MBC3875059.1 FliI/YscN family ATPase [Undibacterium flavidum]
MREDFVTHYQAAIDRAVLIRRVGKVSQFSGLSIEVEGLSASVGELCKIYPRQVNAISLSDRDFIVAEVVGIGRDSLILMPYGVVDGIAAGCEVVAEDQFGKIDVGDALLGRVINCFGEALDSKGEVRTTQTRRLRVAAVNPMQRPRIEHVLETGVRAIDTLLTIGKGQRVGIFSGSGVGKSTLLGMIAKHVKADVNVIALIGERGREVREFIDKQLGEDGLKRSVVVVATSDQPALARIRAAYAALSIAEYFRDQGKQVLLTMDSITRFAMAKREVGLSAGEPPTARGYTPSVFAELPELCERCGTSDSGGAISALMTVLVEGDDFNEPISDALRSILDGHIVLSRQIAHKGQYPAIDILKSISRVMSDLVTPDARKLAVDMVKYLALLERNSQMVDIGAYESGSNPALDAVLVIESQLMNWLRQSEGGEARETGIRALRDILSQIPSTALSTALAREAK